jgi:hypothetical protein
MVSGFISILMVTARTLCTAFGGTGALAGCSQAALEVRYKESYALAGAWISVCDISVGPRSQEVRVTSRLRELIQQLGEAIHESVVESDQIAGVVQDIRKHGFDVLLMLEATIGLNEVSEKEGAESETGTDEGEADGPFTPTDLHFLKSLRISVEGEAENASESDTD